MEDILSRIAAEPAVTTIITAFVAAWIALWLLAALWVHGDADHRTGSEILALGATAWVLLSTPLLWPLSLAAYAFVRPAEPRDERRVRELTAAFVADSLVATSCPSCSELVDGSWRRCPSCSTWLAAPCSACGRWSDSELSACPWCGEVERARPIVAEPSLIDAGPFLTPSPVGVPVVSPVMNRTSAAAGLGGHFGTSVDRGLRVDRDSAARARVAAEGRRVSGRRLRPARPWQRRAPDLRTRSHERAAGGQSGARPRA